MDNVFSDQELEITELPEREEMILNSLLSALGIGISVDLPGIGLGTAAD